MSANLFAGEDSLRVVDLVAVPAAAAAAADRDVGCARCRVAAGRDGNGGTA